MALSARYVFAWVTALCIIMVNHPAAHSHHRYSVHCGCTAAAQEPACAAWRRSELDSLICTFCLGNRTTLRLPTRPGPTDTIHRIHCDVNWRAGCPASAQREGQGSEGKAKALNCAANTGATASTCGSSYTENRCDSARS
eukprot:COSAG02_NODE_2897_length_7780_cov_2.267934_9_plen_140_part_00